MSGPAMSSYGEVARLFGAVSTSPFGLPGTLSSLAREQFVVNPQSERLPGSVGSGLQLDPLVCGHTDADDLGTGFSGDRRPTDTGCHDAHNIRPRKCLTTSRVTGHNSGMASTDRELVDGTATRHGWAINAEDPKMSIQTVRYTRGQRTLVAVYKVGDYKPGMYQAGTSNRRWYEDNLEDLVGRVLDYLTKLPARSVVEG